MTQPSWRAVNWTGGLAFHLAVPQPGIYPKKIVMLTPGYLFTRTYSTQSYNKWENMDSIWMYDEGPVDSRHHSTFIVWDPEAVTCADQGQTWASDALTFKTVLCPVLGQTSGEPQFPRV